MTPAPHVPQMPWVPLQATPRRKSPLGRVITGELGVSLSMSVVVVAALFVGASTWVILRYIVTPPMMFQPAPKMPSLPARTIEHHIRVKNFEQQARRPMLMNRLVSQAPGKLSLPPLPPLSALQADARAVPSFIAPAGAHMGDLGIGSAGIGSGKDAGLAGFSDVQFFGTRIATRSIVVLIDNSPSMRIRGVVAAALNEMSNMVQRFHVDTKFNAIAYRDGSGPFRPDMTFATQQDKKAFTAWTAWLQSTRDGEYCGNQRGTAGTTPRAALAAALAMNPDTIVILRDDQPPYADRDQNGSDARASHAKALCTMIADHQRTAPLRVTVNTLLFKPARIYNQSQYEECVDLMKKLASMSGGAYREIAADTLHAAKAE